MTHRRNFASAFGLALLGVIVGGAGQARAEFLVALGSTSGNSNVLMTFDSATPLVNSGPINISGVTGNIVDIDYRPATGVLYGLSDAGILYTINATNGLATLASVLVPTTGATPVFAGLNGTQFAIDFNPVPDRLRVVAQGSGQNLRINVDTGAVLVDTPLNTGPPTSTPVTTVVGAGYTNSVAGATTTTLYDLTYSGGAFALNTQNPPNNGVIVPVGPTGLTSSSSLNGFDISGATGTAYLAYNNTSITSASILTTINLATGAVTSSTAISSVQFQVRGLAVAPGVAVPEPASLAMVGLGLAGVGFFARRRRSATAN